MLQQQINYWTLRENMRHNRVGEGINQQDADTNRINANTNIWNAQTNAINAVSNRIQANAATIQAGAAVRQAGAAERQASVKEREVTVTEKLMPSKEWNNYLSPLGSTLGQGVNLLGKQIGGKGVSGYVSKVPKLSGPGYFVNPKVVPVTTMLGTGIVLPTPEEQKQMELEQAGNLAGYAARKSNNSIW